jgi:2-polyprenyl-3-methyl-5-hydroxy-6-metoxy-1,4-benzoquinol methylase
VNGRVLSSIPASASRILDVGCGAGDLGECLLAQRKCQVVGITFSQREADIALSRLSEVHCADLNSFDFSHLGKYDCVVLSHVLEHLYDPQGVLLRLKTALTPESTVVVALPNIVWWRQRLEFLAGRWRYRDFGILDRTHFRFFDHKSSAQLLTDTGFEILERTVDGPFPPLKPFRRMLGSFAPRIDRFTCELFPGLLAFQFVFVARLSRQ